MADLVRFRRLKETAVLPSRSTGHAAGHDLAACLDAPLAVLPGERVLIPTGLSMELPADMEGQVRPRSGLAVKHGVTVLNSPGTIDADYRGEIRVALINHGRETFVIEHGMRIAQLVFARVLVPVMEESDYLSETERGSGGFGHTGV